MRPVAPRFFVIGDPVTLEAVVHDDGPRALSAEVSLEATGATLADAAPRKVGVAAGGREQVVWSATVGKADQVTLTFSARGGELADAVELTLPTYHFSAPETVATSTRWTMW